MSQETNKRVLHIMSSHGGGISTFIRNLATEIHRFGIVYDVVTYDKCPQEFIEAIQRTGGDVYQLKNPKKDGWIQFFKSFSRVIKLYDYDIIHCHISGYRALAYKTISNIFSKADFLIHAHYYVDVNQLSVTKRFLHYLNQSINQSISEKYVGCSRNAVQSLFGYKIERDEMVIIPNSINPDDFLLEPEQVAEFKRDNKEKYKIDKNAIVVGQIGRLTPIKNHNLTIQVAELAKMKDLNIRFLVAGSGELEEELKIRITQNNLDDYIQLIGRVSPIEHLFPVLDILLFPSLNEGLGTSAIESQAAGVPVVLSSTIPMEVDLEIGLINRVNLDEAPGVWLNQIIEAAKTKPISINKRSAALEKHNYTNVQAARLYAILITEYTNY